MVEDMGVVMAAAVIGAAVVTTRVEVIAAVATTQAEVTAAVAISRALTLAGTESRGPAGAISRRGAHRMDQTS
jgi:hypothetical protein